MFHLLPVSLAPIASICATEGQVRFGATTGVKIDIATADDGAQFTAVATDGRRLLRVIGTCDQAKPTGADASQYPDLPAVASAPNGQLGAIVPAKEWTKIFRDAEKLTRKTKPILRNVAAVFGEKVSTFCATNLEIDSTSTPRQLDGRFPNTNQVIPIFSEARPPVYEIAVDPSILAELLETVAKLGTDCEAKRVTMSFQNPTEPFTIRGHAPDLEVLGVIVPLTGDKGQRISARSKTDMEREIAELTARLATYEPTEKTDDDQADGEEPYTPQDEAADMEREDLIAQLATAQNRIGQLEDELTGERESHQNTIEALQQSQDAERYADALRDIVATLDPYAKTPNSIAYNIQKTAQNALTK